ncbi:MAG: carbohydrate kinase family protein [Pseudomonadota bacterium]
MSQFDILVVGGVGIDTTVRTQTLPLPLQDSIQVPPVVDYVGHTGNGVALGCHTLGMKTKFIDFIGDDPQAALILARYAQTGLDFSYLIHASGTRRSVNLVDAHGRRLSLYDARHPMDLRMPGDFYLPFLTNARHVHFSIMNWARFLYDEAIASGITISTDLHDWDGISSYHQDFAYRSDLVFLSTAALGQRHEQVMRDILQQGRAKLVIATAGADGSYLLRRGSQAIRHFPCVLPKRAVVDTNGAGDAFVSGFLSRYFGGAPLEQCVLSGSIAGAFACVCLGTHEEFIGADELASSLASHINVSCN